MKTKALQSAPEYYTGYIQLVPDLPLNELFPTGGIELYENHLDTLMAIGDKTYAEGKWTVKEIIQHCMDTERIFINRALRFLREDKTPLPGYDHNAYVPVSRANDRSLSHLINEYKALRLGNSFFFEPLQDEELLRTGKANNLEISVLAIGYILIGHPMHHFNVLQERYFRLARV